MFKNANWPYICSNLHKCPDQKSEHLIRFRFKIHLCFRAKNKTPKKELIYKKLPAASWEMGRHMPCKKKKKNSRRSDHFCRCAENNAACRGAVLVFLQVLYFLRKREHGSVALMRKAEREKARAEKVRLFLGHWSYLCQISGEASAFLPRVFSGSANPALGAGEWGATRWRLKVSPNWWPPFLRLSRGKGGNYAAGMKQEYAAFFFFFTENTPPACFMPWRGMLERKNVTACKRGKITMRELILSSQWNISIFP